jgi:peroxiredoxin Q/BCP
MSSMGRFAFLFLVAALGASGQSAGAQALLTPESSRLPNPTPTGEMSAAALEPHASGLGIASNLVPGEEAPSFELQNAEGRWVRLRELRGQWVALLFANTRASLGPLRRIEGDLMGLGVRLVAVAPDDPRALRAFSNRQRIGFEMLSDPTGEISRLYGMFDPEQIGVRPGLVLVDPTGVARAARHLAPLDPDEVLDSVRQSLFGPAAYQP